MRAIICGGRDFTNWRYVCETLDAIHSRDPISYVIHGGARGADTLAGYWAHIRGVERQVFPANWEDNGKAAGFIRNGQMLKEGKPNVVIAFPGGAGTANMIKQAAAAGIPIIQL